MREKNYNLEIIRMISCIMVITIHAANYFSRAFDSISGGEYIYSICFNVVARVSVPCFFMISGALILGRSYDMKKSLLSAKKFLIILAFWTVAYGLFNIYYTGQGCDWSSVLYDPAKNHLWYLYVMIPIYIMVPFLQGMCKGIDEKLEHGLAVLGFIWLVLTFTLSAVKQDLYYDLPILGDKCYVYYFYMGYYINKHMDKINVKPAALAGIFVLGSIVSIVLTCVNSFERGYHYTSFMQYGSPFIILSSLAFFTLIASAKGGNIPVSDKAKKKINLVCQCSLGIYLIHVMFINFYTVHFKPVDFSAYLMIPALIVYVFVGSLAAVWIIRKVPFGKTIA